MVQLLFLGPYDHSPDFDYNDLPEYDDLEKDDGTEQTPAFGSRYKGGGYEALLKGRKPSEDYAYENDYADYDDDYDEDDSSEEEEEDPDYDDDGEPRNIDNVVSSKEQIDAPESDIDKDEL